MFYWVKEKTSTDLKYKTLSHRLSTYHANKNQILNSSYHFLYITAQRM